MYIIQCYTILYKDLAIYWPLTTEAGCAQQRSYDLLQAGCPLDSSVISSPVSTRLCMFCLDQCAMHLQLWKATEVKCDVYGKRYMSDCVHQGVLRFMSFPKIFIHRGFSYAFTRSPVNYSSLSKLFASCFSALEVASLQAETQHGPPGCTQHPTSNFIRVCRFQKSECTGEMRAANEWPVCRWNEGDDWNAWRILKGDLLNGCFTTNFTGETRRDHRFIAGRCQVWIVRCRSRDY
jgi:hypothetical protein